MAECAEDKKNLGVDRCNKILQLPKGILEAPPTFKFTAAQLADPALLKTAIEALLYGPAGSRGYLWPFATNFENASEAAVYQETALSDLKVRDGKYRFRFFFAAGLCLHTAMFTHRSQGSKSAFYIYDIEEGLYGELVDGELFPFKASLVNSEKLQISDGSVATMSPLYVVLANNRSLDQRGGVVDGSMLEVIQPLTDVTLTVIGTPTATSIVVDVKVTCDGTPVNGLVVDDFVKRVTAGSTQAITSLTEVNGRYSLVGTGWTTGTIDLVEAEDLSVPGYESVAPAAVTIA